MSKEINLLPLRRRRQLARAFLERQLRRLAVSLLLGAVLLTAAAAAAAIGLTAAGTILFPQITEELDQAVLDYRGETRTIQMRNALIVEMQQYHDKRVVWSEQIPQVLALLPGGTELDGMSGTLAARRLVVEGQAAARSAVVVLEDKLKALPWVKSVGAPHSNLLERTRPEFRFEITL